MERIKNAALRDLTGNATRARNQIEGVREIGLQGRLKVVDKRISKAFTGKTRQSQQHRLGVTVERYHGQSHDAPLLLEF